MALSHTSLTWVRSAKIYWKSYPKSRCWLSIWFFCLISASFLAICQIHVGFMALSWHFHGAFFLLIFIVFSKQFHGTCMSDSWQIHRGFMPVFFNPKKSKSCQIHVTFMSLSWQFHGTFTYKPYLGTVCQNLLEKLSKKSVLVVDLVFLPNFSFIFGNMSDSCRFHGPFMALSSFWFLLFFQTVSWRLHGRFMALSWRFHGTFLALSWHFSLWACLDLP